MPYQERGMKEPAAVVLQYFYSISKSHYSSLIIASNEATHQN